MAKYEKWLGASLGWMLTGNPLGGILGFIAGAFLQNDETDNAKQIKGVSEFEVNLIVLASHLLRVDGRPSASEIDFLENFLNTHFDEAYAQQRNSMTMHCMQHEYDLNVACSQVRMYSTAGTRTQVVRFLIDLAQCDGPMTERKHYFIFRIAGYLNINDVAFKKIKTEHVVQTVTVYDILGVKPEMSFAEIRTTYRRLVLKYHPDRNKDASDEEKKRLARKFQQVQEAYEIIKREKEN